MIAKTTIGATIANALAYGAGELGERSREQKAEKVDLLATYNLMAQPGDSPRQVHGEIAAEMKAVVRDHPGRCKKPVWHTSLSLPAGETLDVQSWTKAVDIYLKTVGIDTAQHQVAVFRHRDTAHDHVHIYANRIAMDGGAAVETGWNYALNFKATRQIEQELALTPLTKESKRTSLKDHDPGKQVAREVVSEALKNVLQRDKPTDLKELVSDLEKHRITAKIASNLKGPYGISFQAEGHQAVKGTAVGYKFNQLSVLLEANRAEYQAEIDRLQQERDQAEKSRESEEKARKQAEQERDQTPTVIEKTKEVVKSDPADEARIKQLEHHRQGLREEISKLVENQTRLLERYNKRGETIKDLKNQLEAKSLASALSSKEPATTLSMPQLASKESYWDRFEKQHGFRPEKQQISAIRAGNWVDFPTIGFALRKNLDTEKINQGPLIGKIATVEPLAPMMPQAAPTPKPTPPEPAMVPERPVHHPTPDVPQWHIHLRKVLLDVRKSPGLTMKGYSHVDIKKGGKVVDLKIIHDKTKGSVLLSEFAPDSKLMRNLGLSKGQQI